jgi:uncharacterized protein (DUF362 family)
VSKSKVLLGSTRQGSVLDIVREIFERFDARSMIAKNAKVVIKVNLSTPFKDMAYASNTSPEILDAVCTVLKGHTNRVWVGESNGMRYKSEEAFEASGFYPILGKHGVQAINFSNDEWDETDPRQIKGWGLSRVLLEADVFMTLPVLKTHATTVFTGALKNQFGCYPQHDRIFLHPRLDRAIVTINSVLKPKLVIMDGLTAMEGRGPINGRPRQLGVILGGTDPVAVDATAMRLVGLDPETSKHVVMAAEEGLGIMDVERIDVDGDFEGHRVVFEPAQRDLPIKLLALISRSRFLTKNLILNPESFYPLRSVAVMFREARDFVLGLVRPKRAS